MAANAELNRFEILVAALAAFHAAIIRWTQICLNEAVLIVKLMNHCIAMRYSLPFSQKAL
jgi:hypothetical protein